MQHSVDCSFTTNKCGKSATKPRPLQAATPWFGHILMGQYMYFLVVPYIIFPLFLFLHFLHFTSLLFLLKFLDFNVLYVSVQQYLMYHCQNSPAPFTMFPHRSTPAILPTECKAIQISRTLVTALFLSGIMQ